MTDSFESFTEAAYEVKSYAIFSEEKAKLVCLNTNSESSLRRSIRCVTEAHVIDDGKSKFTTQATLIMQIIVNALFTSVW